MAVDDSPLQALHLDVGYDYYWPSLIDTSEKPINTPTVFPELFLQLLNGNLPEVFSEVS